MKTSKGSQDGSRIMQSTYTPILGIRIIISTAGCRFCRLNAWGGWAVSLALALPSNCIGGIGMLLLQGTYTAKDIDLAQFTSSLEQQGGLWGRLCLVKSQSPSWAAAGAAQQHTALMQDLWSSQDWKPHLLTDCNRKPTKSWSLPKV